MTKADSLVSSHLHGLMGGYTDVQWIHAVPRLLRGPTTSPPHVQETTALTSGKGSAPVPQPTSDLIGLRQG